MSNMVENMDLLVGEEIEMEQPANQQPKFEFTVEIGSGVEAGDNFNVHVLIVPTGEDVKSKILSVVKNWNREIRILSAIGNVSDVSFRQYEGSLRLKGSFVIMNLGGSFPLTETGHTSNGELTVLLAGSDGLIFGGNVADLLIAASPIRLVLGSFIPRNANLPSAIPSVNVVSSNTPTSSDAGTSLSFTTELDVERLSERLSQNNILSENIFLFSV